MENRPIRLAPGVERAVEKQLRSLSGKRLESAQAAILRVYRSGQQLPEDQWVTAYEQAIQSALSEA